MSKEQKERYVCMWNMCYGMGDTFPLALKRLCQAANIRQNQLRGKVGVYHIKSEIVLAELDKEAKEGEAYVYVNEMGGIVVAPSDKVKVDSISLEYGWK